MRTLLIVILQFFVITAFAASPTQTLQQKLTYIQTYQAAFKETAYAEDGKVVQRSRGKVALSRPGKFRWQTTSPLAQLIVADSKNLWIYDKDLEQVTVKPQQKSLGDTPALLLSGKTGALLNQYRVKQAQGWFMLTPKAEDSAYKWVRLKFRGNDLIAMQLADHLDQRTILRFNNVKVNPKISSKLFQFSPPKDVDVIGTPVS